jgi:S-formylglutathione hydrolase FrmB
MATLQTSFYSKSLIRSVDIDIVIPCDPMFDFAPPPPKEFKTLYLLHGYSGTHSDWLLRGSIADLANLLNMAIVMPAGENSFYVDMPPSTMRYSQFIAEDLVEFTRTLLPLSRRREDTLIGGLSMGGYGALYNGLKHYKTFGHIIALSSALVYYEAKQATGELNPMGINKTYFEQIFGDLSQLDSTDKNIETLAEIVKKQTDADGTPLDIFFACGWNDSLVFPNRLLHQKMDAIGLAHEYREGAGTHDMVFWQEWLRFGLARLYEVPEIPKEAQPFWIEKPE